jgi:nucleotide-binding universal stress UspA family protein
MPGGASPENPEEPMYQRVVVPLDGSELAERALPHAEELARLTGAPLHLVRVIDLTRSPAYGAFGMYAGADAMAAVEKEMDQGYLDQVAQGLSSRGVQATVEILRGPTARTLLGLARPGDVIVMATHGRTGPTRWFLGSVAEEVVRHAPVPVLLVRPQAQTASEATGAATEAPVAR